jgi:hypothetical protein
MIAGVRDGYFAPEESPAVLDQINQSGADILLAAFGAPRQEMWLAEQADRLAPPVRLGVGGLFDFYSGRVPRAPQWMREIGMEWLFRLTQEPGRLRRRYVIGNPLFLYRVWRQRMSKISHARPAQIDYGTSDEVRELLIRRFKSLRGTTAIRLDSPGPIFFKQVRVGRYGQYFAMWKFRSMYIDAEARKQVWPLAALAAHLQNPGNVWVKRWLRGNRIGLSEFGRRQRLEFTAYEWNTRVPLPRILAVLTGDLRVMGEESVTPEQAESRLTEWERLMSDAFCAAHRSAGNLLEGFAILFTRRAWLGGSRAC